MVLSSRQMIGSSRSIMKPVIGVESKPRSSLITQTGSTRRAAVAHSHYSREKKEIRPFDLHLPLGNVKSLADDRNEVFVF